ncbi:MAG TPA: NADH-quinone oxidoreductase subunit N [Candidatus Dormibacteraeota bacterium]
MPHYTGAQAFHDLTQIAPIVAILVALLVAIVVDLILPKRFRGPAVALIAFIGYLVSLGIAIGEWQNGSGGSAYYGFATGDAFALFFEMLFAVLGVLTVAVSAPYLEARGWLESEFHVLTLAAVAGMMILGSATSLVTVFLGLELLSLALYVASGFDRSSTRSQEAAAKYLLVGGFASAFVLYGMALVYGATGSTLLPLIAERLGSNPAGNSILLLGLVLMGVGFAFKVSAAPFHMWTPDVYQGAPLPVTMFMSVGTKAAAFAMIIRVFSLGLPHLSAEWQLLLAFVAVVSMIVGNLMAIVQSSVKRLLAYSGVAQAGYVLVGVVAGGNAGLAAVGFYLFAYLFMNLGAFAVLTHLSGPEGDRDRLTDLDGLGQQRPWLGLLMTVFMLSLAGFPPTVGFIGKFFLFAAAVQNGFLWLAVIAVLMSAVSVYYYLRVVVHVWTPVATPAETQLRPGSAVAIAVSGLFSLGLGIYPQLMFGLGLVAAVPILR